MSASLLVISLLIATSQGAGSSAAAIGQVRVSGYVPSSCGVTATASSPAAVRCSAPLFLAGVDHVTGAQRVTIRPLI